MYVTLIFPIHTHSISLSTFILPHQSDRNNGFTLSPFIFFFLYNISIIPGAWPTVGLLDSSLAYPNDADLSNSHRGLYSSSFFFLSCLFISNLRSSNGSKFDLSTDFMISLTSLSPLSSLIDGLLVDTRYHILATNERVKEGDE